MPHALAILAAAGETSKTAFYIGGGLLAAWAVALAAFGMSRATFPQTTGQTRGVIAVSVLLVATAMTTAVVTA